MRNQHRIARRIFRMLLLAYPKEVRRRQGEEMEETFGDQYAAVRSRIGRRDVVVFWLRATWDIVMNAVLERRDRRRRTDELRQQGNRTTGQSRGLAVLEVVGQDLRYALRRLWKTPGFTAIAVAIMGLGIGANAAIFSVVNAVLFRPLPYEHPSELVKIFTSEEDGVTPGAVSYPDFEDYRSVPGLFSGAVAHEMTLFSVQGDGGSQMVFGEHQSWDYLSVLGLAPRLGRTFVPEEDARGASEAVAIVSYAAWQRRHGSDPDIVGKTVRLNGYPVTIVGVGPEGFSGSAVGIASEYWVPWGTASRIQPEGAVGLERRGRRSLFMTARLLPGVTRERVQAALTVTARQLGETHPETNEGRTVAVLPASRVRLHPIIDRALYPVAGLLMAVVALVLAVACSNLANLLLLRASSRQKEVAVRLAIGATRRRLVAQLLTESTLLGVIGGVAGLALAQWVARILVSFRPPLPVQVSVDLGLDWRVLAFALGLSLVTGVLFGLAPSLRASRPDLVPALKNEMRPLDFGRRRISLKNVLVITQVAVSLILLIGAGLFVRSLVNTQQADPGFETATTAYATMDLALGGYDEPRGREFLREMATRLETYPGIEAVGVSDMLPLGIGMQTRDVVIPGYQLPPGESELSVDFNVVDGGYFETLMVPLLRGRAFTEQDAEDVGRVAIVSAAMAERYWGSVDVVGKRLRLGRSDDDPEMEIVGVAGDTKVRTLSEAPRPLLYLPLAQEGGLFASVVVRAVGDPSSLPELMRREIRALDGSVPILEAKTMPEQLAVALFAPRMGAALLSGFGVLAMILASLGLYGVVASSVAQRTREVGVRMALGAGRAQVVRMVVGEGLGLVTVGVLVGLALSVFVMRPLGGLLYAVKPADPFTFGAVAAVLAFVAMVASYVPARRAAKTDPMVALRYE